MTKFELIDLLPTERKRAFRKNYFLRLATVAVLGAAVLLLVHGVLLAPSYFFLAEAKANEEARLRFIEERLASSGDQEIVRRLTKLDRETEHLSTIGVAPAASATVRSLLALPRSGITLVGISYTPPAGKNAGRLQLTGTATTRNALRAYQSTLGTLPGVSAVDLPISAYAKESDIPFTVTLTGTFAP